MWKNQDKPAPLAEFLGWVLFVSLIVEGVLLLLEPYSIAYAEGGGLTLGYAVYAVIGMLASTPTPLIALFITLKRSEKITLREYVKRAAGTPRPIVATLITGTFCAAALTLALVEGRPSGAAWYMMPLGFLIMLPLVGIAEEVGWRGFLQPELEKRLPFPIATSLTAVIWYVWHLPLWLMPSSNHYGDSLIGFAITIFVWSFVSAAIYKATKSVLACAVYHSFINSIGAIWDWNALFDAYPKSTPMLVYFGAVFALALAILVIADKRELSQSLEKSTDPTHNQKA